MKKFLAGISLVVLVLISIALISHFNLLESDIKTNTPITQPPIDALNGEPVKTSPPTSTPTTPAATSTKTPPTVVAPIKTNPSIPVPPPTPISSSLVNECKSPKAGWIWCDDFDQDRLSSYFEYDSNSGDFIRTHDGIDGSMAMRAKWQTGEVAAGHLSLAFGKTPDPYFHAVDAGTANYRDIYWRVYLRNQPGWTGGAGDKLTRAIVFADSSWAEAAVGHVWGSGTNYLALDGVSGTDTAGNLKTTKYNDFNNFRWIGGAPRGTTPLFSSVNVGKWYCVESHMKLNTAGQSDGTNELWINDNLEAQSLNMNWLGNYIAYGINDINLENYWNNGSTQNQERYLDNFIVSTQRIGCGG